MKDKHVTFILGILILIFLGLVIRGFMVTELEKKPILKEENDATYLYDFYVSTLPNIEGRPYYGSEEASITFIMYSDMRSPVSFFEDIFPQLEQEYIFTDKIKFYHKHHLTVEDVEEKTEQYYLAQSLACFETFAPDEFYDFYFSLYTTALEDVTDVVSSYGVSEEEFMDCVKQQTFKDLLEDISEVDNFGIIGVVPRIYIGIEGRDLTALDGVPSYTRLQQEIRQYQVQLGD